MQSVAHHRQLGGVLRRLLHELLDLGPQLVIVEHEVLTPLDAVVHIREELCAVARRDPQGGGGVSVLRETEQAHSARKATQPQTDPDEAAQWLNDRLAHVHIKRRAVRVVHRFTDILAAPPGPPYSNGAHRRY